MFRRFKQALVSLTWSEQPVWISPELRGTRFRKGEHVRRLWLNESLQRVKPERTYVGLGSIDITQLKSRNSQVESARDLLRNKLALPPIADFDRPDLDGEVLRLDLAITELKPGSVVLRRAEMFVFAAPIFFWVGHAWVQIEGVLCRQADDRPLIKFVHRRRNAGWSDPRSSELDNARDSGKQGAYTGELVSWMAYDILMELDSHLNHRAGWAG